MIVKWRGYYSYLCAFVAGSRHEEDWSYVNQGKLKYPCKPCGTKVHFTALCPHVGQETNVNVNAQLREIEIHVKCYPRRHSPRNVALGQGK